MNSESLNSRLSVWTKPQLQDIIELLGPVPGARGSKDKLVEKLHSYLRDEPRRWLSRLSERDLRLLKELVRRRPGSRMQSPYDDYPSLPELLGLVCADHSPQAHSLWLDEEMYSIIQPNVEEVLHSAEKNGRFEVERMVMGYMNLYGVLEADHLYYLISDWFVRRYGSGKMHRLYKHLDESPVIRLYHFQDDLGDQMVSPCVDNEEELLTARKELGMSSWRSFTEDQVLEAGSGGPYYTVGLKTPEGMRLEEMYRRVGYSGMDLAVALHDTWVESQYVVTPNTHLFTPLLESPMGESLDDESWSACCDIIQDYANSVPKWMLQGASANECGKLLVDCDAWDALSGQQEDDSSLQEVEVQEGEPPRWHMPKPTISKGFAQEMFSDDFPLGFAIPHVAPYDPCPCGSGLRYCNCHGKYLS